MVYGPADWPRDPEYALGAPPPPPPPRRSNTAWVVALVCALVALAVVATTLILVFRIRPSEPIVAPSATPSGSPSVAVPTKTVSFTLTNDTNAFPLPAWPGATTREFVEETLQRFYYGWQKAGPLTVEGAAWPTVPQTVVIVYDDDYSDSCSDGPNVTPSDRPYHCVKNDSRIVVPADYLAGQVAERGVARGWNILGQLFMFGQIERRGLAFPSSAKLTAQELKNRIIFCLVGRALSEIYYYNPDRKADVAAVADVATPPDDSVVRIGSSNGYSNQRCFDERETLVA